MGHVYSRLKQSTFEQVKLDNTSNIPTMQGVSQLTFVPARSTSCCVQFLESSAINEHSELFRTTDGRHNTTSDWRKMSEEDGS